MNQLMTGYDLDVEITVQDADGAVVDLSTASAIQARLVRGDHAAPLTPVYTASSSYGGANWALGKVVVAVAAADTAAITVPFGLWELKVTIAGKLKPYLGTIRTTFTKSQIP